MLLTVLNLVVPPMHRMYTLTIEPQGKRAETSINPSSKTNFINSPLLCVNKNKNEKYSIHV